MKRCVPLMLSVFLFSETGHTSVLYYLSPFFKETTDYVTSPLRWDKRDWLLFSAVMTTTAFLIYQDKNIQKLVQQKRREEIDRILSAGNTFGDGYFVIPFLSLSLASAYLFKDNKLKSFSIKATKSFILTGATVTIMKVITSRERPNGADFRSFPSGHTAVAFALATSISKEFGDNPALPIFSYSLALMSGLARIEYNVHWASDVLFGAVLGIYTAKFVHEWRDNNISVLPYKDGIMITWRF